MEKSLVHTGFWFSIPSFHTPKLVPSPILQNKAPASSRPVLPTNVDAKIRFEVLTLSLEALISVLIKPDQTGFIKGKSFFHNTRPLNVTQLTSDNDFQSLASLNSLPEFERVERRNFK